MFFSVLFSEVVACCFSPDSMLIRIRISPKLWHVYHCVMISNAKMPEVQCVQRSSEAKVRYLKARARPKGPPCRTLNQTWPASDFEPCSIQHATLFQHLISQANISCRIQQQLLVLDRTGHCTCLSHGDINCDSR